MAGIISRDSASSPSILRYKSGDFDHLKIGAETDYTLYSPASDMSDHSKVLGAVDVSWFDVRDSDASIGASTTKLDTKVLALTNVNADTARPMSYAVRPDIQINLDTAIDLLPQVKSDSLDFYRKSIQQRLKISDIN